MTTEDDSNKKIYDEGKFSICSFCSFLNQPNRRTTSEYYLVREAELNDKRRTPTNERGRIRIPQAKEH